MARRTKRLFTIGYEQTPSKAVLDELEAAGVKLLVDVRAVASSRRPGFSKNQLAAGLDERGISYLHLKGLGTPKSGREAARGGKFGLLHKIYSAHLKTAQAKEELDELSALVNKSGPVCILCYERDHAHCHRQWIAEDRKSTRLNSSHLVISYAVFCLKKKNNRVVCPPPSCAPCTHSVPAPLLTALRPAPFQSGLMVGPHGSARGMTLCTGHLPPAPDV